MKNTTIFQSMVFIIGVLASGVAMHGADSSLFTRALSNSTNFNSEDFKMFALTSANYKRFDALLTRDDVQAFKVVWAHEKEQFIAHLCNLSLTPYTPLSMVAYYGSEKCFNYLLEQGEDPSATDSLATSLESGNVDNAKRARMVQQLSLARQGLLKKSQPEVKQVAENKSSNTSRDLLVKEVLGAFENNKQRHHRQSEVRKGNSILRALQKVRARKAKERIDQTMIGDANDILASDELYLSGQNIVSRS